MRLVSTLIIAILASQVATSADVSKLIRHIQAVGREGAGNPQAAAAWRELSQLPAAEIPNLLAAIDGSSGAAANWFRSAIESIVARERKAGREIPTSPLVAFLQDTRHNGRARRFAFELLCSIDPALRMRMLPSMLDDPSAELRFDAITSAFDVVRQLPKDDATAKPELTRLLSAARDGTQIENIAKELERRGVQVDLLTHFGFITHWQIAGPFDNTGGKGFATAYAPERGVDLSQTYSGKNGAIVKWSPHLTTDKAGIVDLNAVFPDPNSVRDRKGKLKGQKAAVAYAYTEVESPTDRAIEVRAASSPAIKVFVNGREVLAKEAYHQTFDRDSHSAPARLKQGRNSILVKICQNDQPEDWAQNWMFQLRLTDELGAKAPIHVVTPAVAESRR